MTYKSRGNTTLPIKIWRGWSIRPCAQGDGKYQKMAMMNIYLLKYVRENLWVNLYKPVIDHLWPFLWVNFYCVMPIPRFLNFKNFKCSQHVSFFISIHFLFLFLLLGQSGSNNDGLFSTKTLISLIFLI